MVTDHFFDAVYGDPEAAEQAAEVDHNIRDGCNVHVLAVHVEDAPLSGSADITAGDLAPFIINGDDDRALAIVDAIHFLVEHAFGLIVVPIHRIRLDDCNDFFGLIQLEIEGAFGLDDFAVLDVRLFAVGVGVVLIEEEPDDHGDGHSARRGKEDHAVVIGEIAVILEAGVVVGIQLRDPLVGHTFLHQVLEIGPFVDRLGDGVRHRKPCDITEPFIIASECR